MTGTHDKPSLATVGCGFFSQFHHQAWQRLAVDRVAVCDINAQRAEQYRKLYNFESAYTDFHRMLQNAKPDIVDIILPPDQHLDHILIALRHGSHVICQKPFTLNSDQARQAVAAADQTNTMLVVHENFRFQPWYRKIKSIIDNGFLGALFQIQFNLRPGDGQGPHAYLDRQPYFQNMDQFLVKETGIHFIDVFRFLFGDPIAVFADLRRLNPAIKGEDAGIFILEFEQDRRAIFDGNRLSDHIAENRRLTMGELSLEAEKATLRLDGDGGIWLRPHGSNEVNRIDYEFTNAGFGGDCVYLLQNHVLKCVHSGEAPENQARDYLKNLHIQSAIYRSNELGAKIKLSGCESC